jgi:prevent-host-death family protein
MCYMTAIGIREARQNLSVYLERVKRGEAVTITEHGRPVAVLRPIDASENPVTALIAAGRAQAATRRGIDLPRSKRQTGKNATA